MPKLLPTFILAISLAAPASAQNSDELQDALDAGRRVAAAAAEANPTPATPGYAAEVRGEQAYELAARLYRKACDEARDALSCYRLGYLYERGRGVPQDSRQAAAWYDRALAIDPNNRLARAGLATVRPAPAPAPSAARRVEQSPAPLAGKFGGLDFSASVSKESLNRLVWRKWPIANPGEPERNFYSILNNDRNNITYISVYFIAGNVVTFFVNSLDCKKKTSEFLYFGEIQSFDSYEFTRQTKGPQKSESIVDSEICSGKAHGIARINIPPQ